MVFRNYYICSPTWEDKLEFYSTINLNDLFSSFLRKITTNSSIIIMKKTAGELILNNLKPGKRLFLLCSDIGAAAASSIISEPGTYSKFNEVIVVLTCEYVQGLQYFNNKLKQLAKEPLIQSHAKNKLRFFRCVTQEPYPYSGDISWLIKSGLLIADLKTYNFNKMDRFIISGPRQPSLDVINLLGLIGYNEDSTSCLKDFIYERVFVNQIRKTIAVFNVLLEQLNESFPNKDQWLQLSFDLSVSSPFQPLSANQSRVGRDQKECVSLCLKLERDLSLID
ncbi:Ferredoxin--NADP reductase [Candidatus Hodgkinia cicadicola]|uniref:Ferredoxin--NADP reductase n=1 Tax=Candidatus Hodgkinia cicadicola TaxID=573658 RepID=A0ABX4MI35_9HYPH|nr:Ferredoxin--NADP reductase [Candidatus Hodgkinia cicadicola]